MLFFYFFVLVDIRPPEHFMKEHIIGATNVPYEKIGDWAAHVAKRISEEIVIYLYSEDGIKSDQAAKMLRKKASGKDSDSGSAYQSPGSLNSNESPQI